MPMGFQGDAALEASETIRRDVAREVGQPVGLPCITWGTISGPGAADEEALCLARMTVVGISRDVLMAWNFNALEDDTLAEQTKVLERFEIRR